jgi:hypothetical protein
MPQMADLQRASEGGICAAITAAEPGENQPAKPLPQHQQGKHPRLSLVERYLPGGETGRYFAGTGRYGGIGRRRNRSADKWKSVSRKYEG